MRLLLGGSPCTHWSIAQTKNRETEPSGLGWELFKNYLIAREKYKPDYFLYENNKSMANAIREQITKDLGVPPVLINSALVSAQNRQRLYWAGKRMPDGSYTPLDIQQPEDRGILLRDILETVTNEKGYILKPVGKPLTDREMEYMVRETSGGRNHFDFDYHHDSTKDKGSCITANTHRGVPYNVLTEKIEAKCVASRGRYIGAGGSVEQHFEAREDEKTSTLTTVQKDNMAAIRIGTIENDAQNQDHDSQQYRVYSPDGKAVTLCGNGGGVGAKTGLYAVPVGASTKIKYPIYRVENGRITVKEKEYPIKLKDGWYIIRKLTVTECKRLQTVPDSYVFPVSDSQAYKMLGNGWTVEVIAHILSHIPEIRTEPLEVLSMYDGMSCGHIALDRLGAGVAAYYATEIDKYAIQNTQHNYPDTVQLGDAFQVREDGWRLPEEAE